MSKYHYLCLVLLILKYNKHRFINKEIVVLVVILTIFVMNHYYIVYMPPNAQCLKQ